MIKLLTINRVTLLLMGIGMVSTIAVVICVSAVGGKKPTVEFNFSESSKALSPEQNLAVANGAIAASQPATRVLYSDISILLSHGRGEDALEKLRALESQIDGSSWSDGRISWYKSLAYRVIGNHRKASLWQSKAQKSGIPELGAGLYTFWDQQKHWSSDLYADVELVGRDLTNDGFQFVSLVSQADSIAYTAQQMVGEIRKERQGTLTGTDDPEQVLNLVKLATWEILLGEYTAFHDSLALWTTSVDSFVRGKQLLREIEAEIELNPDLESVISTQPEVAIRLDSARVRLVAIERKEAMSRQEEVARLHQLRLIAKQYRSMVDSMLKWNSYSTLQDSTKSNDSAVKALEFLQEVKVTVGERSEDFHLFDDEPPVESDEEFSILDIKPVPLSANPLAQLKATRGYGLYLEAIKETDEKRVAGLLKQAEEWANAALDETQNMADLPIGADPDNLVGKLTLGLVYIEKANAQSFSSEGKQREQAEVGYKLAQNQLTELRNLLNGLGYNDTEAIPETLTYHMDMLESKDFGSDNGWAFFLAGEPERARHELRLSTKIHRATSTALNSILIGIHSGLTVAELKAEWNEYAGAKVFSEANIDAKLAWAQITCMAAGRALTDDSDIEAASLLAELEENSGTLGELANDPRLPEETRNHVKANLALTLACRWALNGDKAKQSNVFGADDVKVAYRHARDAEFFFQKQADLKTGPLSSFPELQARDSLVAARLALGHLAAMHLDDWRDESKIFLTAAVQEAAKLPRVDPVLPLLGEPLLKQFFNDSKNRDQKLAAEERQRRQMVTRCLEALFVVRFGNPDAGAKQMSEAVALGEVSSDLGSKVDAAELSAAADGFDAKISLPDTVKAFEVLSLLEAGQSEIAFQKVLALASGGAVTLEDFENRSQEKAAACLSSIESPLVAFVFAAALESRLSEWPVSEDLDGRVWIAERALEVLNRGQVMLDEMRLATRYPHIRAVIRDRIAEFSNANSFVEFAQVAIDSGDAEIANVKARDGLSKHAKEPELWDLYLRSGIVLAVRASASNETRLEDLLTEIGVAGQKQLITNYSAFELSAKALEELGRDAEAADNYSKAADAAESDVNRIRASANAERLRVGIMASAN